MQRDIEITHTKAPCDSSFHAVVGYKSVASSYKAEAAKWFQNAGIKALSYQSLIEDAMLAMYNEDNKSAGNPVSEAIEKSGAHLDNPLAANMRLKFMPAAHELGILVEIRMKCLIYAEGKRPWGHDLHALWSDVADDVRREIDRHYRHQVQSHAGQMPKAMSEGNIVDDLELIGDSFIDWRYETEADSETYLRFIKLGFINHVLEYAMLKYRAQ